MNNKSMHVKSALSKYQIYLFEYNLSRNKVGSTSHALSFSHLVFIRFYGSVALFLSANRTPEFGYGS